MKRGRGHGTGQRGRVVALGLALLTTAGCGVQPSGVIIGLSPPSGSVDAAAGNTLYLVADGRLQAVTRPGPVMSQAATLQLLASGPTVDERVRGLGSEVPPEAAPFSVSVDPPHRVVVTVSARVDDLSATAVDQIVCTVATRLPDDRAAVALFGQSSPPRSCPELR